MCNCKEKIMVIELAAPGQNKATNHLIVMRSPNGGLSYNLTSLNTCSPHSIANLQCKKRLPDFDLGTSLFPRIQGTIHTGIYRVLGKEVAP